MLKYLKVKYLLCLIIGHKWQKELMPNHIIRQTCTRCGSLINVTTELTFKNNK